MLCPLRVITRSKWPNENRVKQPPMYVFMYVILKHREPKQLLQLFKAAGLETLAWHSDGSEVPV